MTKKIESLFTIDKDTNDNYAIVYVHGFLSSAEFRGISEKVLDFIKTHKVTKVILEIHALGIPYAADRTWYMEDFLPRVINAGLQYVGIIVPRNRLAGLVVEDIINSITPGKLQVYTYTNISEARAWIESLQ